MMIRDKKNIDHLWLDGATSGWKQFFHPRKSWCTSSNHRGCYCRWPAEACCEDL